MLETLESFWTDVDLKIYQKEKGRIQIVDNGINVELVEDPFVLVNMLKPAN